MTKIISIILKFIMSKEAYNQRRNNSVFILYGIYQLFIRTLKLRIKKKKIFFFTFKAYWGNISFKYVNCNF